MFTLFNYQNHDFCRLPIVSVQAFVIRAYRSHDYGSQLWGCFGGCSSINLENPYEPW